MSTITDNDKLNNENGDNGGDDDDVPTIETANDLTTETLTKVMRKYCQDLSLTTSATIQVKSLDIRTIDEGVLSLCLDITVHYCKSDNGDTTSGDAIIKTLPTRLIGKIVRQELYLGHMMKVECEFYQHHARYLSEQLQIPFVLPRCIYASSTCILLERLPSEQYMSCTCLEASTKLSSAQINECITRLATFHAKCWNYNKRGLSETPGVGASLDGLTKERYFPQLWERFLTKVPCFSSTERTQLHHILSIMNQYQIIRHVHHLVESIRATLIHGDYHVANILFDSNNKNSKLCLLDWATCGIGNPLRDLVFFCMLCMDLPEKKDVINVVRLYYETFITADKFAQGQLSPLLTSFDECWNQFRICVLNQLAILVAYDGITQEVLDSYKKTLDGTDKSHTSYGKLKASYDAKKAHFSKVYERCAKLVLACWSSSLDKLAAMTPIKTKEDLEEEHRLQIIPLHPSV